MSEYLGYEATFSELIIPGGLVPIAYLSKQLLDTAAAHGVPRENVSHDLESNNHPFVPYFTDTPDYVQALWQGEAAPHCFPQEFLAVNLARDALVISFQTRVSGVWNPVLRHSLLTTGKDSDTHNIYTRLEERDPMRGLQQEYKVNNEHIQDFTDKFYESIALMGMGYIADRAKRAHALAA